MVYVSVKYYGTCATLLCKCCWDGMAGDALLVVNVAAKALMAQLQSP